MQSELAANHPDLAIQILGVNAAGYEVPNPIFTSGRDIPWLQDVDDDQDGRSDAWVSWGTYDGDVVVLDATNTMVGFFNLSSYSLEDPAHYKTLRQTLVDTAVVPNRPRWPCSPWPSSGCSSTPGIRGRSDRGPYEL